MTSMAIRLAALVVVAGMTVACANTIRGIGHDTANAVQATQDAGRSVERAAQ